MFLGIDTSAYTTSLAIVDKECNLIFDQRLLLQVPMGEQGLRQSTALFYHLQNLPLLIKEVFAEFKPSELCAIAVSSQPRPTADSYMPVFLAGLQIAECLAVALGVPLVKTTHQEGHLTAGLWSVGKLELKDFLAVHLSGGTSDILLVRKKQEKQRKFAVEVLGSSLDLHAGQLVDRVGVALGLPFPAGPALEQLAKQAVSIKELTSEKRDNIIIKSAVKGFDLSFSGAETAAKRYLAAQTPKPLIARAVEHCLATSLEKVLRKAIRETGIRDVLLVGGVAANNYLRSRLQQRLEHPAVGARLYYPQGKYCSDNAVGVSIIAQSTMQDSNI